MQAWFDHLVPAELRRDAETLRRARLTVLLSIVLIGTGLAYAAFYGLAVRFVPGAVTTGAGSFMGALVLRAMYLRPRDFHAGAHVLTLVLYAVLVVLVYQTGGLSSFVSPWFILPGMFSALLVGRRGAGWWTVASVLAIAVFHSAETMGVEFAVGYDARWRTMVNLVSFGGLVASTAVLVWVYEDIRVEAQARAEAASAALQRLAYHDALTGLTNRARFLEVLGGALERARRAGDPSRVAVLLLDLDGFKAVNDTFGHAAGDALLQDVATRLLSATRGTDTVARLGGDEFAVLLDGVKEESAMTVVADRIVKSIGAPFVLGGSVATIGTSIGIARGYRRAAAQLAIPEGVAAIESMAAMDGAEPPAARVPTPGSDVAAMLHDADAAMYRAKALGKNRWQRYEEGMHEASAHSPAADPMPRRPVMNARLGLACPGA